MHARPGGTALARSYATFWNCAEKKGYSGTAIFTKERPLKVMPHVGIVEHDREGRVLTAEYKDFFLVTFTRQTPSANSNG